MTAPSESEDPSREIIFREIMEQPAIAAARAGAEPPPWPATSGRLLITGSGDSLCAAEAVARTWPELGARALGSLDASGAALELGAGDALIAISVSGRTPRVVEAARRARKRGATVVAVTDDPDGPLAEAAHQVWHIGAAPQDELQQTDYQTDAAREYVGYHHDVAQTKSFLAVVLAIARAADPSSGDWPQLADHVAALTAPAFAEPIQERAAHWAEAGQSYFLASGSALPLARFAAYKMFEFNRVAHFAEIEEYCHTHYFVTRPGDTVVFLLRDDDDAQRAAEIAPVLVELFDARTAAVHHAGLELPASWRGDSVALPAGEGRLQRLVGWILATEWITYLQGRLGAPDIDTFHAGFDTERLIAASMRTIRRSRVRE